MLMSQARRAEPVSQNEPNPWWDAHANEETRDKGQLEGNELTDNQRGIEPQANRFVTMIFQVTPTLLGSQLIMMPLHQRKGFLVWPEQLNQGTCGHIGGCSFPQISPPSLSCHICVR